MATRTRLCTQIFEPVLIFVLKCPISHFFVFLQQKILKLLCLYYLIAGQFAMSHGSYDSNLGSEILILGGDIRSRSWPNIGDSYSK